MSDASKNRALAGKCIVVTRPAHQAEQLAALIRAEGGEPLIFPAIEIVDIEDQAPLHALIDRLDAFEWAVFVSPNAVHKAMRLIKARRALPSNLRFAAVGQGSVRELNDCGVPGAIAPARFDSEALLEMPAMQNVAGRRVVIFRGDGGRELVGDTLAARGALVEYAECYRRRLPQSDATPLVEAWARGEVHAITVTSSVGLRNFCELVGVRGRPWLLKTPVFVPHARIAATARELGLDCVVPTGQADAGLLAGLKQWFAARA